MTSTECAAPQGYALMMVPVPGAAQLSCSSSWPPANHSISEPPPPAGTRPPPLVTAENALTCVLRNLPESYSTASFIAHLDAEGFAGLYDFAYLPRSFETGCCFGYGFSKWSVPYAKKATTSWCEPYQGLAEHIARYRDSPMMHHSVPDDYKPMLFRDGVRINFPPPTRRIKAPRVRRARGAH